MEVNGPPPCLIFIGITGAGKSTASIFFEQAFRCQRVPRTTTRLPRSDDEVGVVNCVSFITFLSNDFRYVGWGSDVYKLSAADVGGIRGKQLWPLIELGDPTDAIRCRKHFHPAHVIWLTRAGTENTLRETLRLRNPGHRFDARLESLNEDLVSLQTHRAEYDHVVANDGDIESLKLLLRTLAEGIGCFPRV